MSPPQFYDPNSPDEQPVALPSAPQITLAEGLVLQPPLTRRGTGPGLIAFIPSDSTLNLSSKSGDYKPLDPEPFQKWAEEGFAVVGITTGHGPVQENLKIAIEGLLNLAELDTRDKFAVAVYDPGVLSDVVSAIPQDSRLVCLVVYGYSPASSPPVPTLVCLPSSVTVASAPNLTVCTLDCPWASFVLPQTVDFHSAAASIAHSKAAVHFKKYLGGPFFDLEAIWEEHTYFEFEVRSVAKTMGTMVAEPYVNHVPTLAGGIGRKQLSAFYRDHFVFSNPKDTRMQTISRTVGSDRVVDEFIFHATHDTQIDWLLPGVPPTGKKIAIPMLGVINIRGDRLYHEHIWWDQGTACMQIGILPTHVPVDGKTLRLPIAGVESATLLVDERAVPPNEMMGVGYGFVKDV
ncbi:NTF2-like protein [Mycena albidolilacea]|uniref:NTF2-like protein n=1 Tax=Mycena albidolilacea TaxID=1033008 RepID=A0AAD7F697_9AGAR|nr:NTF2-like protein [Mycena albidolilacea]